MESELYWCISACSPPPPPTNSHEWWPAGIVTPAPNTAFLARGMAGKGIQHRGFCHMRQRTISLDIRIRHRTEQGQTKGGHDL